MTDESQRTGTGLATLWDLLELLGTSLVARRHPSVGTSGASSGILRMSVRLGSRYGRREQHIDAAAVASGRGR